MNIFGVIFVSCVTVDILVPDVNVSLGWHLLWAVLWVVFHQYIDKSKNKEKGEKG